MHFWQSQLLASNNRCVLHTLGSHLLISLSTSECLYLNRNTQKVRSLSRWRGHLIESVGWNKLLGSETNTGPILVGTSQGIIFEAEISASEGSLFNTNPDQYFRQVSARAFMCSVCWSVWKWKCGPYFDFFSGRFTRWRRMGSQHQSVAWRWSETWRTSTSSSPPPVNACSSSWVRQLRGLSSKASAPFSVRTRTCCPVSRSSQPTWATVWLLSTPRSFAAPLKHLPGWWVMEFFMVSWTTPGLTHCWAMCR